MLHDRFGRVRARATGAALFYVPVLGTRALSAQLPGLPAAQSAFPAPGLAVGFNAGHGDGRTVAGLVGATGVRRLQLTAAIGLPGALSGYDRSGVSGGARVSARLYRTTRLGVSAFAGYGGERMRLQPLAATTGSADTSTARPTGRFTRIPVGVSAGVRGLFGDRPYAVSIAPMYAYSRWKIADTSRTRSGARVAALAELALTPRIGAGVAAEVGGGGPPGSPYAPRGAVLGVGLSYAIHRVVAR
ncbi:hypothetical protein tb265_33080 [Gemmatimonadetes bacterium T265]|nr:hypothetical protein tb265_33080 [Gemmatimonadetes bacterium T265]